MVVGEAGASRRGNREHVREVLPEFGEKVDVVCGGGFDGLIDRWRARVGPRAAGERASLL